jgi:hypothetical protein
VEHVKLTWTIYVEPLALCALVVEETRIFEREQKKRELEKELEVALNYLRKPLFLWQHHHHKSLLFQT